MSKKQHNEAPGVVYVSGKWKFRIRRGGCERALVRGLIGTAMREATVRFSQATGIAFGYRYSLIMNQSNIVAVNVAFEIPDLSSDSADDYFTRALEAVVCAPVTIEGMRLTQAKFRTASRYHVHYIKDAHMDEAMVLWDTPVKVVA